MILASTQPVHDQHVLADEAVNLDWGEPERSDIAGEWRAWNEPRTPRQRAYLAIWRRLRLATAEQRDLAMNTLRQHFETARDPLGGPLSSDEIRTLLCDGLIQLGAHTVTHPVLTLLDRLECRREIVDSGNRCRELAAQSVNGFAYPYGDMSIEVQRDVARLGFSWACSTQGNFAEQPNIYALPRIAVPNAPMRTLIALMTSPR
jgi:peptidoglycan/xylan/chitin deacetylase (PgdA/CDA1 family)